MVQKFEQPVQKHCNILWFIHLLHDRLCQLIVKLQKNWWKEDIQKKRLQRSSVGIHSVYLEAGWHWT